MVLGVNSNNYFWRGLYLAVCWMRTPLHGLFYLTFKRFIILLYSVVRTLNAQIFGGAYIWNYLAIQWKENPWHWSFYRVFNRLIYLSQSCMHGRSKTSVATVIVASACLSAINVMQTTTSLGTSHKKMAWLCFGDFMLYYLTSHQKLSRLMFWPSETRGPGEVSDIKNTR